MSDRAAKTVPARNATAVTTSDSTTYAECRAIYVGGAGDVAVVMRGQAGGPAVTLSSVPAGSMLPIDVEKVMSTNTTATNIVLFW